MQCIADFRIQVNVRDMDEPGQGSVIVTYGAWAGMK